MVARTSDGWIFTGTTVMARYNAKTLALVDIVPVAQHEASFVTVDPKTMIAYSMDRFGGDALLRYDLRKKSTTACSAST